MIKFKLSQLKSLKMGITMAVVVGILAAVVVYAMTFFAFESFRVNYYDTEEEKNAREQRIVEDFQSYVVERELSSSDRDSILDFVKQKKHIYLLVNDIGYLDFYFSANDGATVISDLSELISLGSVNYPTAEKMREYAEANDLVSVEMLDGPAFVSVAEFSGYFYMDVARVLSIAFAMLTLALVIIIYFFRVIKRITRLAAEVNVVADGDMSRSINADGSDEISKLSADVENMRKVILQTLESERQARAANTELVTSMSHDIRTPLTVLIGYLDIMKTYSKDEVMDEYIRSSEKTALRLKELSDDMFRYLIVFGNSAEPCALEEYDCATLVDQLLSEHILLLSENGYDVRFTSNEATGISVLTSAPELMRIIDNMFSNIRKYADKASPVCVDMTVGEGKVSLTFSNRVLRESVMTESTGIGLKTCSKIAELISCDFSYTKNGEFFESYIGLKSQRSEKI